MGKWTPDDHGCIYDEAGCFARLTPNKAERLATRHNADIDALTAERDELQRRLDAVVAMLKTTHSKARYTDLRIRQLYEQARAIAEGREG